MKKVETLALVMLGIALVAGSVFAGIKEDISAANAISLKKDYAAAQVAFEKIIVDYPKATKNELAVIKLNIGANLEFQHKYADAQSVYEGIIKDYPAVNLNLLSEVQSSIGVCLYRQGKYVEATKAYIKAVILTARSPGPGQPKKLMSLFAKVNSSLMAPDEYKAALTDIIKATPATEPNTEFLGRIKSELEKMK